MAVKKVKRIFLVGGGSSLKDFDFSVLDNEDTVAINESLFRLKNPTFFITVDYDWLEGKRDSYEFIKYKKSKAQKFFIANMSKGTQLKYKDCKYVHYGKEYNLEDYDVVIRSPKVSGFGNFNNFCHGQNSGYCALQLALIMRYEEIYLLGFDLTSDEKGDVHFHHQYKDIVRKKYGKTFKHDEWYEHEFELYYRMFRKGIEEYNGKAKIYSCSQISRLNEIIDFVDIGKIFKNAGAKVKKVTLRKNKRFDAIWKKALGQRIIQKKEELYGLFLEIQKKEKHENVLEIGCLQGGTSLFFSELYDNVFSIDLKKGYDNDLNVHFIQGNSQAQSTIDKIHALCRKFDLIMFDGDHSEDGIKKDFDNYLQFAVKGTMIVFHDILQTEWHKKNGCEVSKFWDKIKLDFRYKEICYTGNLKHKNHKVDWINEKHPSDWGGIGILYI